MKVIEKFISINGEGLKQGELAVFIRFMGCNLRCPYCDTKYSYINPKWEELSVSDLVSFIESTKIRNITLTGGEPLIEEDIDKLINELSKLNYNIELETNGAVDIKKYVGLKGVSFTLDYKVPSSLMEDKMLVSNYKYLTKNDVVKFVVQDKNDLDKMKEIIEKYDLVNICNPFVSAVFGKIELSQIVDYLKDNLLNGVRLQLQIHKFIWDSNKRGV